MNTTHNFFTLMKPIKALWHWVMVEPGHTARHQNHKNEWATPPVHHGSSAPGSHATKIQPGIPRPALRRPVRVLQVMETGQPVNKIGRLRISGRMADVCAELDRLAARELLFH